MGTKTQRQNRRAQYAREYDRCPGFARCAAPTPGNYSHACTLRTGHLAQCRCSCALNPYGPLPIWWIPQPELDGISVTTDLWHRDDRGWEWVGLIDRAGTLLGFGVYSRR